MALRVSAFGTRLVSPLYASLNLNQPTDSHSLPELSRQSASRNASGRRGGLRMGLRGGWAVSGLLALGMPVLATAASATPESVQFAGTVSTLGSGFSGPGGVAVDKAGDVFVADTNNSLVKEIVAVNGSIPANPTILTLGSGYKSPQGVAVDGAGDVFVGDTGNQLVKEIPTSCIAGVINTSPNAVIPQGQTQPAAITSNQIVFLYQMTNATLYSASKSDSYSDELYATLDPMPIVQQFQSMAVNPDISNNYTVLQCQATATSIPEVVLDALVTSSLAGSPLMATKASFDNYNLGWLWENGKLFPSSQLLILLNDYADNATTLTALQINSTRIQGFDVASCLPGEP